MSAFGFSPVTVAIFCLVLVVLGLGSAAIGGMTWTRAIVSALPLTAVFAVNLKRASNARRGSDR